VSPDLVDALLAAGLGSPAAIVKGGREKLGLVVDAADRADAIYAAAEKWAESHRAHGPAGIEDDDSPATTPEETPAPA
jgi:hypothetical protein